MRLLTALSVIALAAGTYSAQADRFSGYRVVCPLLFQPVCATRGDETRTFVNACRAQQAGFTIYQRGPCEGGSGKTLN